MSYDSHDYGPERPPMSAVVVMILVVVLGVWMLYGLLKTLVEVFQ